MKKNTYFALAALVFAACQNAEIESPAVQAEAPVFKACTETSTKTVLDGLDILWEGYDYLNVYVGNSEPTAYRIPYEYRGQITAELELVDRNVNTSGYSIPVNIATYGNLHRSPAGASAFPDGTTYHFEYYNDGYWATEGGKIHGLPMVAITQSTSDHILAFKNILGVLKLQLKGTAKIKTITVKGNDHEKLNGMFYVTVRYGEDPRMPWDDLATGETVELNCYQNDNGIQLNETTATEFVIPIRPVTFSQGFTVVITDMDGGSMEVVSNREQIIIRNEILRMPVLTYKADGPEYVDLGLSVKWATCNLGASMPEGYGDYFQWASKWAFDGIWVGCYFGGTYWDEADYGHHTWTKYVPSYCSEYWAGNGAPDNKSVLDLEDDAAHFIYGGGWRIPTVAEWEELLDNLNCSWTWTTNNGICGYRVQSLKPGFTDRWIFLPTAGYIDDEAELIENYGEYWSNSMPWGTNPSIYWELASIVKFSYSNMPEVSAMYRFYGLPIRPVCE